MARDLMRKRRAPLQRGFLAARHCHCMGRLCKPYWLLEVLAQEAHVKLIFSAALALVCAGCAGPEENPKFEASDFYIFRDDVQNEPPTDICRSRDPQFLKRLLARIRSALPPELEPSFKFEDFNVPQSEEVAVLRFFLSIPGEGPVMHFAVGNFEPATCKLTAIEIGRGVHPMEDPDQPRIPVP